MVSTKIKLMSLRTCSGTSLRSFWLAFGKIKKIKEVPEQVRSDMSFIFVDTIEEVLPAAFQEKQAKEDHPALTAMAN